MSRLASARGKPSRSSSAIVADRAAGYHDLKIDLCSLDGAGDVGRPPHVLPLHRRRPPLAHQVLPRRRPPRERGLRLPLPRPRRGGRRGAGDGAVPVQRRGGEACPVLPQVEEQDAAHADGSPPFRRRRRVLGYTVHDVRREGATRPLARRHQSDRFTVRCGIVILNGFRTVGEAAPPPRASTSVTVPAPDLHRHLGDLLGSGRGADVVFQVGGETFAAHRCVLAARSPVFSVELFGAMVEGGAGAVVQVDDMEPLAFKALLCFVYTDSLPEMNKEEEDVMYQHLLVIGGQTGRTARHSTGTTSARHDAARH
ncbi:hypothetical protein ACP70R_021268 [Stipagrostis hirtigluma subsp. patula]